MFNEVEYRAHLAGEIGVPNRLYCRLGKRALDLTLGSLVLVAVSPILLLAVLAVALTSKGPAIFAQNRVGKDGRLFVMYKFRTMYADHAEIEGMDKIVEEEKQGLVHKNDRDPRVTPVGRILRKTSIDELPQLWNVVRGEMSLVGPRPLVPHMLDQYPDVSRIRSQVLPGITGLWQVSSRTDNTSVIGMVRYDFQYIRECSLRSDLVILLRTPIAVLSMRGAQ